MSKRFDDYTDAELLGIDNETLNNAIRIEAIAKAFWGRVEGGEWPDA